MPSLRFELHDLYTESSIVGSALSVPFQMEQNSTALFAMDRNASPGPDGFGPSFYRAFWQHIKPHLLDLFSEFYSGAVDLDGLNRAHLVLLPKKEGVLSPDGFRPISLQNCPMKLFSKVMVNRLKNSITDLIDPDQTGFIHGRNIAESYVYAADLLSCCHKRGAPTVVLKLDFKKAFDSVSWESLDAIMEARGFDQRWRMWISCMLSSGKTAVMLNGVPGRWINYKRGLRQGDPISPYLFIIVADVLQRLIRRASQYDTLEHPLVAHLPCPVLQYADDTLILIKGNVGAVRALKSILDDFSLATGVSINFHKSTFVRVNIPIDDATEMAQAMGCPVSQFPQTYLGLPLSPLKLRVRDYQPLIANFDRFLAGWKARLLSTGGRLVLVNAVLSSLAIYYMSSCLLPKTLLEELDKRRRAFLWTGEEHCNGSQCLVAWERVCCEQIFGGLGVRPLQHQNHALLLKFVHKLHEPTALPWKTWFLSQHEHALGQVEPDSYMARIVHEKLPIYRALTTFRLGDGKSTSFWHDKWILNTTLAETFPALFSHCIRPHLTVNEGVGRPIRSLFRDRLSNSATEELWIVQDCLNAVTLTDEPDQRMMFDRPATAFSSKKVTHTLQCHLQEDPDAARIWKSRLPKKVRFFAWLLHHGRLNCRAYLHRRNIRRAEESFCELCPQELEDDTHIFSICPQATAVWARINIHPSTANCRYPWMIGKELQLPNSVHLDVILLILWQLWKARNAVIFEYKRSSVREIVRKVVQDMERWSERYKKHAEDWSAWRVFLSHFL